MDGDRVNSRAPVRVAVVIVAFRNADDVERCLQSLAKSSYTNFEIVICENGGDAAFDLLQSKVPSILFSGQAVRLVKAPTNGGYASGINIAMGQSPDADAWWILNPDTEPMPEAMAALVDRAADGYDAVGGPILFPSKEVQSFGGVWAGWQAKAISIGFGSPAETVPDTTVIEQAQNFLSGASMYVGRKFAHAAGPMDERYFLYCEEVDWFLRAERQGLRFGFTPGAIVIHHQGTTTGYSRSLRERSPISVYLDERNKMLLTRTFFPLRLPIAGLMALARLIIRYLREGAFAQVFSGMKGWYAGLRGQSGIPGVKLGQSHF